MAAGRQRLRKVLPALLVALVALSVATIKFSTHYISNPADDIESQLVNFPPKLPQHLKQSAVNKSDTSTKWNDNNSTSPVGKQRPTFLWGIPTIQKEAAQRQLLRRTYLRFYRFYGEPTEQYRICSLHELETGKATLGSDTNGNECQIAYVFFMGANPEGPTELVKPNASFPMTIEAQSNFDEVDLVHLNIKENMEDGKSQTWLKYGSMLSEKYAFDYIAKVDQDALFFIPNFLRYAEETLEVYPNNVRVFGGLPYGALACDRNAENHPHSCPLELTGPYYFSGEFYYMSPDLAAYVASDEVDRAKLAIYHEDVDIGNYVFSNPKNVTAHPVSHKRVIILSDTNAMYQRIDVDPLGLLWAHTSSWQGSYYKDPIHFEGSWREYVNFKLFNVSTNFNFALRNLPPPNNFDIGLVHPDDYIYSSSFHPFTAPIVLESHKLVFFLQTGMQETTWIHLFRRMNGVTKRNKNSTPWMDGGTKLGLTFLSDYNLTEASRIMTSPEYTRAMFVRDPQDRARDLWTFSRDEMWPLTKCCKGKPEDFWTIPFQSFDSFVQLVNNCAMPYYRPSGERMEPKYFRYINFVGHYEDLTADSERLLKKIGAWSEYGASGWGKDGSHRIFSKQPGFLNDTLANETISLETKDLIAHVYKLDYQRFNLTP